MSGLLDQLARVRELQGREAIDPGHIEGAPFPVPPLDFGAISPSAAMGPPPAPEFEDDEAPPLPDGGPALETPRMAAEPRQAPPEVVVALGGETRLAAFQGREVMLSEQEAAGVKRLVLGAIIRQAQEELRKAGLKPTRSRVARASSVMRVEPNVVAGHSVTSPAPQRRRVRRKSALRDRV